MNGFSKVRQPFADSRVGNNLRIKKTLKRIDICFNLKKAHLDHFNER
jgi:hypothetical protein